jgi:LmbE family N-acetylglucosaminyl deacetylase
MRRCRVVLLCLVAIAAGAAVATRGMPRLPADRGAAGAWQNLLKLRTTASVLYTTAHPDDEQGGLLAWLGRGEGARVSLLTLNRGEGGDNAIGEELFDAVGLIRTDELLLADRYYGVDEQYFTTAVDYGFSKRLDEALDKWGHERMLGEVVRVIRLDRPLVLVSRWQGSSRDGHGNHQASGLLTREAYQAAGDPAAFPEHLKEGLRPWQPLKLYTGGWRDDERWTARIDTGVYSPWLGESYANFGRIGLSFQRSQNAGRLNLAPGPAPLFFGRLASRLVAPAEESSLFDGIPTRLSAVFSLFGRPAPPSLVPVLGEMERQVEAALEAFTVHDPSASVPALARGLAATREAIRLAAGEPDALFVLQAKERQFAAAIHTALGLELTAIAQPRGTAEPSGPFAAFAPPPTLAPVVAGQTFEVVARLTNRGHPEIVPEALELSAGAGWAIEAPVLASEPLKTNGTLTRRFAVTLADDVPATNRPHFQRSSIAEPHYAVAREAERQRPWPEPAATVVARYSVAGVPVEARAIVRRREARPPYGHELRELAVLPALSVRVTPAVTVVPVGAPRPVSVEVAVTSQVDVPLSADVALELPAGWTSQPPAQAVTFSRAGERRTGRFVVTSPAVGTGRFEVRAVARARGQTFTEGFETIEHRDLETRYLYRPARLTVRGVDVRTAPGLRVGYVMGVGDQVPAGIAQLGATVEMLDAEDLATGDLSGFDAVITGTRAYGVRPDLVTHNARLLDYAKAGGHLLVLYNTPPDLDPVRQAPFPGELPRDAEEVSEEDSPVTILAPGHELLTWPNAIGPADFEGWVEQRGSKFWRTWDPGYTALIATHDQGQAPQQGGWLSARYGDGRYTYFAYALHRQLPYGVPGAYRLLANLLSERQRRADGRSRGGSS